MQPGYHERCESVKPAIPAVRHEPHPGYPGSVATYVASDGRLLPIMDVAWLLATLEEIAAIRKQWAVAA
jgi:hypothetical protein